MKYSEIPTDYIILKAATNSGYNSCDFAIIHITKEWKEKMQQRQQLAAQFKGVPDFSGIRFRDYSVTFYEDGENFSADEILREKEDWAYILLDEGESDNLVECDNHLCGSQLHIDESGIAFYSANAAYTNEEYFTNDFRVSQFLG